MAEWTGSGVLVELLRSRGEICHREKNNSCVSQGGVTPLCFASTIFRALLSKKKLILIDEATSSVDAEADLKIQQLIKNEFKGCTVLSIQHRLTNVSFYDR